MITKNSENNCYKISKRKDKPSSKLPIILLYQQQTLKKLEKKRQNKLKNKPKKPVKEENNKLVSESVNGLSTQSLVLSHPTAAQ